MDESHDRWLTSGSTEAGSDGGPKPASDRTACVWLTGLSGAGKTTTGAALVGRLVEAGHAATLLDGDHIRAGAVVPIGFAPADRDRHVLNVAALALDAMAGGQIAVCALISPYRSTRARVRSLVGADRFIEVHVNAALAVCEARDPKGLYARARRGEVGDFTGVTAPYEPPTTPDLVLDTVAQTVADNVSTVLGVLRRRRVLR
jgi:adenylyl-sulfate kinase